MTNEDKIKELRAKIDELFHGEKFLLVIDTDSTAILGTNIGEKYLPKCDVTIPFVGVLHCLNEDGSFDHKTMKEFIRAVYEEGNEKMVVETGSKFVN